MKCAEYSSLEWVQRRFLVEAVMKMCESTDGVEFLHNLSDIVFRRTVLLSRQLLYQSRIRISNIITFRYYNN
jgi:hypothetical protein